MAVAFPEPPSRSASILQPSDAGGGAGYGGKPTGGGRSAFPEGLRLLVVFGGNTAAAVSTAAGVLSVEWGIGIGLGLVVVFWIYDLITRLRS
jgi:hypothetical protein